MTVQTVVPVRERILETVTDLLRAGGVAAVSTRAVSLAAGVHAPMIYRLFGDKQGLLDAAAEYGLAQHLAQKHRRDWPAEPVAALRSGWDEQIEFALSNSALYLLMVDPWRMASSPAAVSSVDALRQRVHALAGAGRLRVDETRATELIHSTARGVALAMINAPSESGDMALSVLAREAVIAAIADDAAEAADAPDTAAAVTAAVITLRASLPTLSVLSVSEAALLTEWLDRIVAADADR